MNGLMADCAIGKGRALVLADADLLRDASWFGPGAQGESRGARIADNGHLVSAAAQMLLAGQDSMSASDVRWMTAVPKRDVPLILAALAIPLLLPCAGTPTRLQTLSTTPSPPYTPLSPAPPPPASPPLPPP